MSKEQEFKKILRLLEKRSLASAEEDLLPQIEQICLLFHEHLEAQEEETPSETLGKLARSLMLLIHDECERLPPKMRKEVVLSEGYQKLSNYVAAQSSGVASKIDLEEPEELPLTAEINLIEEDKNYEFFFIQDRQDEPYFHPSIVKELMHVALKGDGLSQQEAEADPLLQVRKIVDHTLHLAAKEMLALLDEEIHRFYKEAMKYKDDPVIAYLHQAMMALRMAAVEKSLVGSQGVKNVIEYYQDFHAFLRQALEAKRGEREDWPFAREVERLLQLSCFAFFSRFDAKADMIALIIELMGQKKEQEIEELDKALRKRLSFYPQGPLMKLLDLLQEETEGAKGFDPLSQGNFPGGQFSFFVNGNQVNVLRIACPTLQTHIDRCMVVPEFLPFLSYGKETAKKEKHLLINLQNRASWKETARCRRLELFSKEAQVQDVFLLIEMDPDLRFEESSQIKPDLLFQQLCHEHSFVAPPSMDQKKLKKLFSGVHSLFFGEVKEFSFTQAECFREIFYLFVILKVVEENKVSSLSFTCKDALDVGAIYSALFYALLHLSLGDLGWKQEHRETLLWLIYAPALATRERVTRVSEVQRLCAVLKLFEKKGKLEKRQIKELFPTLS